jgi:hypothetical protein
MVERATNISHGTMHGWQRICLLTVTEEIRSTGQNYKILPLNGLPISSAPRLEHIFELQEFVQIIDAINEERAHSNIATCFHCSTGLGIVRTIPQRPENPLPTWKFLQSAHKMSVEPLTSTRRQTSA